MNANELADHIEKYFDSEPYCNEVVTMLRQQQAEIEALKASQRFAQNFAEEQHRRACELEEAQENAEPVAWTDKEIQLIVKEWFNCHPEEKLTTQFAMPLHSVVDLCKAILRKVQEK